jgi:23S rRNA (cytidine1920-2'-O)/16S rRNA (cytidine1409-2'-O)-methyltransferase
LDKYLVEEGYFESRNRALEAIKAGRVKHNGKTAKPSTKVDANDKIEVAREKFYVSRAARKLECFLSEYPVSFENKRVIDVGASTGGFTQIALEAGAREVVAVDVGKAQLHESLRKDARVRVCEEQDVRTFTPETRADIVTCDVSFISLLHIIDALDRLVKDGGYIIVLYKPQFEAGKSAKRNAKGVVQDTEAVARAMRRFEDAAFALGWKLEAKAPSCVKGKEGNEEWMYGFVKSQKSKVDSRIIKNNFNY